MKRKKSYYFALVFLYFSFIASFIFIVTNGNFREVGGDFSMYFKPLSNIEKFQIPIEYWFSEVPSPEQIKLGIEKTTSFIPSPFYTLVFLGPLAIHNSDFIFAIQGVILAFMLFCFVYKNLYQIYKTTFEQRTFNFLMFISCLNPAFVKDCLTSGPTSVCNLFIIMGINYRKRIILSSILFSLAAMTRSSYFIYWFAILLAFLITNPKSIQSFLKITSLSIFTYIIFYLLYYSSYPGSGFSYLFHPGLPGMQEMANFSINSLSKYYEISKIDDILFLNIKFFDLIKLILSDFKVFYSAFSIWIFKIFSSLGFLHLGFFIDSRDLWFQKLSYLLYAVFILIPSFTFGSLSTILINVKSNFWAKNEQLLITASILFILIHSFFFGLPRYSTAVNWILVVFLGKFILWTRKQSISFEN